MKNKRNCFLITNSYPYGERSFLDNEIKFLSINFENVYIFSLSEKRETRAQLPENVTAFPLSINKKTFRKIRRFLRGFFDARIKISSCTLRNRIFSYYSRGQFSYIVSSIQKRIKNGKLDVSNAVFYSFWLHETAVACWFLRDYYAKKSKGCVSISRAHGGDLYSYRSEHNYLPFQKENIMNMDAIYACSSNGMQYLKEKYPSFQGKIFTAFLATQDYGIYKYNDSDSTCITFVTCSFLRPLKRVSLFAKAFCKLLDKNHNLVWHCFGDGEEREIINEIVTSNGRQSNVHFYGNVNNEFVINFYKTNRVDFFVNVSESEGLPVSIMEAMSFGIPAIATDVGGTSDLVSNNNGRLINKDITPNVLIDILAEEISLPKKEQLAKRAMARQNWEQKFSAEKTYEKWCYDILSIKSKYK